MKIEDQQHIFPQALAAVNRPIFVIGTMRSGTGFMGIQLNASANIVGCPFELRNIWSRVGNVPMASDVSGTVCPGLDATDIDSVRVSELKEAFARQVIKNIGKKSWSQELRFLNKNPHLCNKLGLVRAIFSEAKIVWTIRDLDSVVVSLKNLFSRKGMAERDVRHIWPSSRNHGGSRCFSVTQGSDGFDDVPANRCFPGGEIEFLAEYWLESNTAMLEAYLEVGKDYILPVMQHELLNKPDCIGRKICEFLELRDGELDKFGNTVDKAKVGQWKIHLDDDEQESLMQFRTRYAEKINLIESLSACS